MKFETTITILDENDMPVLVSRATTSLAPPAIAEVAAAPTESAAVPSEASASTPAHPEMPAVIPVYNPLQPDHAAPMFYMMPVLQAPASAPVVQAPDRQPVVQQPAANVAVPAQAAVEEREAASFAQPE